MIFSVMCVCCRPTYSGRQVCGRTIRGHTGGRSHTRKVTQDFSTFLLRCLPIFSREKDPAFPFSLVDREVKFCVLTNQSFSSCWAFFFLLFFFFFCEEESQFVGQHRDSNSRPNVRRFRRYYLLNHRGDRVSIKYWPRAYRSVVSRLNVQDSSSEQA